MENKIYKGAIRTVVFVNNTFQYGFVNTPWNDRELLLFQSGETKQGCRISAIRDRSLGRSTQQGNKTVVTLKEPQTVYFRVGLNQKNEIIAVKLRDNNHISSEEKNAAVLNYTRPSVRELLPDFAEVCLTAPADKKGKTMDEWLAKYDVIYKKYGNKDLRDEQEKRKVNKKKRPNPKASKIVEEEESFGCDGDFALPYNKVRQFLAVADNSKEEEEFIDEPPEEVEDVDDNKYDIYDNDDLYEDDDEPRKMRKNDDK